jgi:hypothetical protein
MAVEAVADLKTVVPTITIRRNRNIIITTAQARKTLLLLTSFEERLVKMSIGF